MDKETQKKMRQLQISFDCETNNKKATAFKNGFESGHTIGKAEGIKCDGCGDELSGLCDPCIDLALGEGEK